MKVGRNMLSTAVFVAAVLVFSGGCSRESGRAVNVVGSTSVQPFAELLAQELERKAPEDPVEVQGGGSTAGIQAIANGLADIGMCSRSLNEEEAAKFKPIIVARDGLAIVVHPDNAITNLTTDQLRGLFTGKIKNWKEVGGADGPVRPITREEGSGTRESFMNLVMGKEKVSRGALTQESNGAVKELVKGDRAAIGYMSLGLVGSELKAIMVDGVQATSANVLAGTYKLARPFLFVTNGTVRPEAQQFIDYVLSDDGQRMLEAEGLVRAK